MPASSFASLLDVTPSSSYNPDELDPSYDADSNWYSSSKQAASDEHNDHKDNTAHATAIKGSRLLREQSSLRVKNDDVSHSQQYKGKIVSRKDLMDDVEGEELEDDAADEDDSVDSDVEVSDNDAEIGSDDDADADDAMYAEMDMDSKELQELMAEAAENGGFDDDDDDSSDDEDDPWTLFNPADKPDQSDEAVFRGHRRSRISFGKKLEHVKEFLKTDLVSPAPVPTPAAVKANRVESQRPALTKPNFDDDAAASSEEDEVTFNKQSDDISVAATDDNAVEALSGSDEEEKFSSEGEEESSSDDAASDDDDQTNSKLQEQLEALQQSQQSDQQVKLTSTTAEAEAKKSQAIVNQHTISDALSAIRIKLQPLLSAVNRLPAADEVAEYNTADEGDSNNVEALYSSVNATAQQLLSDLLALQSSWAQQTAGTEHLPHQWKAGQKRKRSDAQHDADDTDAASLQHILEFISSSAEWRNALLDRWYARVQLTSGQSTLIKNRQLKVINASLAQQIDEQWSVDQERLVKKSQTRKANDNQPHFGVQQHTASNSAAKDTAEESKSGPSDDQTHQSPIYDDLDMYQQLLRDILNHSTAPANGEDAEAPSGAAVPLHRFKTKQPVDRRATKGRKIKYAVIPKLVNFCAPQTKVDDQENEHTINQLLTNLFGSSSTIQQQS